MFIKTTRAKGYEYVRLVESYRDEAGVARHNVLYNFGRSDALKNNPSFIKVVKKLCEICEIGIRDDAPQYDCSEALFLHYGHIIYRKLWEDLGIGACLRRLDEQTKCEFSLSETAFLMAMQHLLLPKSKLGTYAHQGNYEGLPPIKLQQLYRSLDKLAEHKESIEAELFNENYTKVGARVDVVFYDVTTFAFESVIVDELRNFGYSKACKFGEVQVVMGLLIDANGFPIGYELFPGNTFDGKTMTAALGNISRRFGVNKVIIVADRGLNSKGNLSQIKAAGYEYIVSSRLKSMKAPIVEQLFDETGYINLTDEFRYKVIPYTNTFKDEDGQIQQLEERLVVSYSAKRAAKDCADRQKLIAKAEKLLENPASIEGLSKRGGKKYIASDKAKGREKYSLNAELIERNERFDGYYGIQSSEANLTPEAIMDAYHHLWKIEERFRIMKSQLETRPIFHWKPRRIHGHFVLCFLAFMLERRLEILLAEA
jgi:transposase